MKHSRYAAVALLFASLTVAVAPVISQGFLPDIPTVSDKIDRYESEIRVYEAKDRSKPVKEGETLFIGSSTFRLWPNLEGEFRDMHAVNRAFGGATIDEINHYVNRIVIPYKPSRIVFYAGTNDLANGDSAKDVYGDFMEFERAVHKALPKTKIYFVSMTPGPIRAGLQKLYDAANSMISAEGQRSHKFKFVDVRPVMYDSKGHLKENLFGFDRLHMNKAGQDAWEPIIRNALNKDK